MTDFNILDTLKGLAADSGIGALVQNPGNLVMIGIACFLLYLAIVKKFEPLLLIPISFGMLLANLPLAGLMNPPVYEYLADATHNGKEGVRVVMEDGTVMYQYVQSSGGLLYCIAAKARKKWERGKTAWEKQRYSNLYPVSLIRRLSPISCPGFRLFRNFAQASPRLRAFRTAP